MAKLTISHNGVTANFSQRKRTGKRAKKAERKRLKIESRRISRIEREGIERKEQGVLKKEEKAFVDRQAERDKQKPLGRRRYLSCLNPMLPESPRKKSGWPDLSLISKGLPRPSALYSEAPQQAPREEDCLRHLHWYLSASG